MAVYKNNKTNKWFYRVYVSINNTKIQKYKSGFLTKHDAKIAELNLLKDVDVNNNFLTKDKENNLKFIDLYNIFIKWKEQKLKPQSFRATKSRYENYIIPFFKNYYLNEIDDKVYLKWKDFIIEKNFSYKYNASLHGCMVSILNYAIDFYDLDKNIASKIGNFSKANYIPNVNFWTYDEFQKFICVVDEKIYYILFNVLYFTGMRLGECLALTWNDFVDNEIRITKTIAKGKKDGNYIITSPKTLTSNRKIKIDKNTCRLLNELKDYYKTIINFSNNWFIFGGFFALSQTTIGRKKNFYCKKAKVKQIRIHDFRHSHATFLLSNNIPINVISKRLGHKNVSTTLNIYSHFIPSDEDKALQLIDNL